LFNNPIERHHFSPGKPFSIPSNQVRGRIEKAVSQEIPKIPLFRLPSIPVARRITIEMNVR
jgi:hypothetical protein